MFWAEKPFIDIERFVNTQIDRNWLWGNVPMTEFGKITPVFPANRATGPTTQPQKKGGVVRVASIDALDAWYYVSFYVKQNANQLSLDFIILL